MRELKADFISFRDDPLILYPDYQENMTLDPLPEDYFLRIMTGDPDYDPDLNVAVYADGKPAGFVSGVVREGGTAGIKFFFIRKEYRRRGLGTKLFEEMFRRFDRRGVKEIAPGEISPNYITPGIDPRYTEAVCFLEKSGFRKTGTGVNMTVNLKDRDWQTSLDHYLSRGEGDVQIRYPDRREWEKTARGIREMGFSDRWIYQAGLSVDRDPPGCVTAVLGNRIRGFACWGALKPGLFGPMGTAPELRGQGIGKILLAAGLARMEQAGFRICEINSVGPVPFYAKTAGARISRVFWKYQLRR
ncbi:MAG: GNAT family N-acetyltransferase [Spirochaetia bacterium]